MPTHEHTPGYCQGCVVSHDACASLSLDLDQRRHAPAQAGVVLIGQIDRHRVHHVAPIVLRLVPDLAYYARELVVQNGGIPFGSTVVSARLEMYVWDQRYLSGGDLDSGVYRVTTGPWTEAGLSNTANWTASWTWKPWRRPGNRRSNGTRCCAHRLCGRASTVRCKWSIPR